MTIQAKMSEAERFQAFCYCYLMKYILAPFSDMHREWMELIQQGDVALAAPRGFAKSKIIAIFYPLYLLLMKPGTEIYLVSASLGLGVSHLNQIALELETNSELIRDFGLRRGSTWKTDEIHLKDGGKCKVFGAGSQVRGFRPDMIIVDDLEDDVDVLNENSRNNLKHWFLTALLNTLKPNGRAIFIGTILHPFSLLSEIINELDKSVCESWTRKLYRALDVDDKSVWEAHWTTETLHKKRLNIGTAAFEQEFMNNPVPDDWRVFKLDQICTYKELPTKLEFSMTVDPARSLSTKADFTAITVVGTDVDGKMYVAETFRKRMLPDELLKTMFEVYERWHPHTVAIETFAFQELIKYSFEEECRRRKMYMNIVEINSKSKAVSIHKDQRIKALQPYVVTARLLIHESQKELIREMVTYPGRNDDLIDALAMQLAIVHPANPTTEAQYKPDTVGYWMNELNRTNYTRSSKRWH